MKCIHCQNEIKETEKHCTKCGAKKVSIFGKANLFFWVELLIAIIIASLVMIMPEIINSIKDGSFFEALPVIIQVPISIILWGVFFLLHNLKCLLIVPLLYAINYFGVFIYYTHIVKKKDEINL